MIAWGLVAILVAAVLIGLPLFGIVGLITAYCYAFYGDGFLQGIIEDIFFAADKEVLLAIPLFILAGNLMTHGSISRRLIRVAAALTAPVPSGLAVAAVLSCGIFAAISGSSPVTLIAIGSVLYPALRKANYPKDFAMGILSAGGTLGIIIPPSIPMIIFAIMAGVSVTDLFMAGVGPGIFLMLLLMAYALYRGRRMERGRWSVAEIGASLKDGALALAMPGIILGGIYSGVFTATESAAIAVLYAALVELLVFRELKARILPRVLVESVETLGVLFLILVLAVSFNKFLTFQQVPERMVAALSGMISTKAGFLVAVNLLLLGVGCLMDIMSAILILAPLLTPLALHFGMNPIHFGILMIVNLEIGYLTPPVGVNLFVASSVFKETLGSVVKAVLPLVLVLLVGLVVISAVPWLSLFLLRK